MIRRDIVTLSHEQFIRRFTVPRQRRYLFVCRVPSCILRDTCYEALAMMFRYSEEEFRRELYLPSRHPRDFRSESVFEGRSYYGILTSCIPRLESIQLSLILSSTCFTST